MRAPTEEIQFEPADRDPKEDAITDDRGLHTTLLDVAATGARATSADFPVRTAGETDLIDVTERVREAVRDAEVATGIALVSVPHTTCSLMVNENEPGFLSDVRRALERLVPRDADYAHDGAPHEGEDEVPNGYSHVRAALLSSHSVMLPVRDGALALGRWQRIFLVELDHARARTVQVTVLGA